MTMENVVISGLNALESIGGDVSKVRQQVERNLIDSVTDQLSKKQMSEEWILVLQKICQIEGSIMEELHHLNEERTQAA
jgi:hypothetical protein